MRRLARRRAGLARQALLVALAAPALARERRRLACRLAKGEAPASRLARQPAMRVGELAGLARRPPRPAREPAGLAVRAACPAGGDSGVQGFGGSLRRRV